MVSDLRKKKMVHVFNSFFDLDHSGYINIKDCDVFIEKMANYLKLKPGDAKYKELKDQWYQVWEGMINDIDVDRDGELCLSEWVAYWDRMAKDPNMRPAWFEMYAKVVYNYQVDPKVGKITTDGHVNGISIYGFDPKESAAAFQKLSCGKGVISWDEYKDLWRDFFTTDDPDLPGNYLAGKASF